jgi:hypothetical protein
VVDAADYTVWQNSVGSATLPNRDPANTGNVGAADLASWRARFGNDLLPAPASFGANVPEPGGLLLALVGLAMAATGPRRRARG